MWVPQRVSSPFTELPGGNGAPCIWVGLGVQGMYFHPLGRRGRGFPLQAIGSRVYSKGQHV